MKVIDIASVTHAANCALQVIHADPTIPVAPSWADLDEDTKFSVMEGVADILNGDVTTPEQSHANWVRYKLTQGWTWGATKDVELKRHPLLIHYAELPDIHRVKDELFFAIVTALRDA